MDRELSTFGAILSFAIELETEAAAFYDAMAAGAHGDAQEMLAALGAAHRKRAREGERVRREQVTEMILEPIYGFHQDDWRVELSAANRATAVALENKLGAFYAEAAAKVALPQVARYLRKVATDAVGLTAQAAALP